MKLNYEARGCERLGWNEAYILEMNEQEAQVIVALLSHLKSKAAYEALNSIEAMFPYDHPLQPENCCEKIKQTLEIVEANADNTISVLTAFEEVSE